MGIAELNRREILQLGSLGALGLLAARAGWSAQSGGALITKGIPATNEQLPVVGIGTNSFNLANSNTLSAVLSRFTELGATLIDTAASYGESEEVIGKVLAELKLRNKVFIATKLTGGGAMQMGPPGGGGGPPGGGRPGGGAGGAGGPPGGGPPNMGPQVYGKESLDRSLQRLQTDHLDLLEVHNLNGVDTLMPQLIEWKKAGKIRYLGITTSNDSQHEAVAEAIRKYTLDFVQVNYSLGLRNAEKVVFPVAQERKVAVIANVPLGGRGGSLISAAKGRMLPAWAADFGATSWAQLLLKYVVSHPAVTATITGMTKVEHVDDNLQASRGKLPDAAQRKKIEDYWASKA
ncbi:MAG: aldo/keto reductase [Steroidobacteraceae bacterium]